MAQRQSSERHVSTPLRSISGRVIAPDGKLRKVILFSQIDNATRFIRHSYLVIIDGEDAAAQECGLKQAILKYGVPRVCYVDRCPASIAHSLRAICAELGVQLLHADAGDAEAKSSIERVALHAQGQGSLQIGWQQVGGAEAAWLQIGRQ